MRSALLAAGIKPALRIVTPFDPSRRATARVKDALPAPTMCPHCTSDVEIHKNSAIYGREFGEWPWAFICMNKKCGAYVGMHPFTGLPLGTLATGAIRDARKRAKAKFNPLWHNGLMTRSEAYQWLADQLDIPLVACHIGWSDVAQCDRIISVIDARGAA